MEFSITTLIRAAQPFPWGGFCSSRTDPNDASLATSLTKARAWLDKCIEEHANLPGGACRQADEDIKLPTRVIDVGVDSSIKDVKLYETGNKSGLYIALSHCWGHVQPLTTTKSTLRDRLECIPWDSLPQTFQDAITVTRQLGLRYIWIDSLCILQDDETDWMNESVKMASVYGHSHLTIAAMWATNATEGLFPREGSRPFPPHNLNHTLPDDVSCEVYARKSMDHTNLSPQRRYYPDDKDTFFRLAYRGWTLQEYYLPPRLLNFCHGEVAWECLSELECCCMRQPKDFVEGTKKTFAASFKNTSQEDAIVEWHKTVSNYTSRSFTKEQDKLPAISGLAQRFHEKIQGAYYAGLWGCDLINELIWRPNNMNDCTKVASPYLAPSWSWVSLWGRVTWGTTDKKSRLNADELDAEILEVHTILAGPDAFGRVLDGYIKLSARIISTTYHFHYRGGRKGMDRFTCGKDSREGEMLPDVSINLSGPGLIPDGSTLYCLRLGRVMEICEKLFTPRFLVLQAVSDQPGVFKRVGLLNMMPQDDSAWFDGVERQEVMII